ncbi:MAG: class I SAM-dependent methyltransferase [Leeuwenhoekiella sp.]
MTLKENHKSSIQVKDYAVTGEVFNLIYDSSLDVLHTTPKPKSDDLGRYYESDNYISHTDSKQNITDKLYQTVKKHMLRKKLAIVKKYRKKGKILDIGAGTGDFLKEAQSEGWEIYGVEPNETAREGASKKGINLESTIDAISEQFDVITMWHVLEHVEDTNAQVEWLQKKLSKDGVVFIAVPNFKSYDAKKYKEFWAAYDVPRHLFHFSQNAIEKIFAAYNFEIVDTKPLWFDSFYVSILSEKYMNKKFAFLRGMVTGLLSNFSAMRTTEYSSLIYVLKQVKN